MSPSNIGESLFHLFYAQTRFIGLNSERSPLINNPLVKNY